MTTLFLFCFLTQISIIHVNNMHKIQLILPVKTVGWDMERIQGVLDSNHFSAEGLLGQTLLVHNLFPSLQGPEMHKQLGQLNLRLFLELNSSQAHSHSKWPVYQKTFRKLFCCHLIWFELSWPANSSWCYV